MELEYHGNVFTASVRKIIDMQGLFYDKQWYESLPESRKQAGIYFMFRDVYRTKQESMISKKSGLRYDITVIPPFMLGNEFVKTAGHEHPVVQGFEKKSLTYPEIYQVLEGEAHYLVQKMEPSTGKVLEFYAIKAGKWDTVLIPPNCAHFTVNASGKNLKMANWVALFSSEYDRIKRLGGACYFETPGGFVKNIMYGEHPQIKYIKPGRVFESLGDSGDMDMYSMINKHETLDFLKDPEKALEIWKGVIG